MTASEYLETADVDVFVAERTESRFSVNRGHWASQKGRDISRLDEVDGNVFILNLYGNIIPHGSSNEIGGMPLCNPLRSFLNNLSLNRSRFSYGDPTVVDCGGVHCNRWRIVWVRHLNCKVSDRRQRNL